MSHELRTPLTPIRGYAELLARRKDLGRPQVEGFLQEILASTARMSRAVELLVDVAALEAGRVAAEVSKVSVRSLVEDRLQVWKERYPERDGDFRRRCNMGMVELEKVAGEDKTLLHEMIESHYRYTGSRKAKTILDASDLMLRKFVKIMPIDYKRVLAERKAAAAKELAQKEMAAHG